MDGEGAVAKYGALRRMTAITWKPYQTIPELLEIDSILCCDIHIWASGDDSYVVIRRTEDGLEEAVRGSWEKARPVWELLMQAHEERHAIVHEYSAPKRSSVDESAWVPYHRRDSVRISETSCCGIYEWASQGGIFFVLKRTSDGYLETARGRYRFARQEWMRLLEEHREAHWKMPRQAKRRRGGKAGAKQTRTSN